MKQKIIAFSLLLVTAIVSTPSYADEVECNSNPLFAQNECQVCMQEDPIQATRSGDTYNASIENVEFEWENLSDQFQELIYEDEQQMPMISSNLSVTKDPEKDDNFWAYSEQVIWTEYEGVNEFYINPGSKVFFRKSKSGAQIKVSEKNWPTDNGYVLIKSPLVYRDFQIDSFEESDRKTRNYCTLYTLEADTSAPAVDTTDDEIIMPDTGADDPVIDVPEDNNDTMDLPPAQDDEPEVELNSADPVPEITANQTQTPTGTAHILIVVVAAIAGLIFVRKKRLA